MRHTTLPGLREQMSVPVLCSEEVRPTGGHCPSCGNPIREATRHTQSNLIPCLSLKEQDAESGWNGTARLDVSRLFKQHHDWYLPVGLSLILRVGWVLLYNARPQPRPLVPLRPLGDHRADLVSELDAHPRVCAKV
jgi:hypothetical protein